MKILSTHASWIAIAVVALAAASSLAAAGRIRHLVKRDMKKSAEAAPKDDSLLLREILHRLKKSSPIGICSRRETIPKKVAIVECWRPPEIRGLRAIAHHHNAHAAGGPRFARTQRG